MTADGHISQIQDDLLARLVQDPVEESLGLALRLAGRVEQQRPRDRIAALAFVAFSTVGAMPDSPVCLEIFSIFTPGTS